MSRFAQAGPATWTSALPSLEAVRSTARRMLTRGRVFVVFGWGGTLVVAYCASLNDPLSKMKDTMNEVRDAVERFSVNQRLELLLGHFNAMSIAWESWRTEVRTCYRLSSWTGSSAFK